MGMMGDWKCLTKNDFCGCRERFKRFNKQQGAAVVCWRSVQTLIFIKVVLITFIC